MRIDGSAMRALEERKASPVAPGYCLVTEADRECGLVGTVPQGVLQPTKKSKRSPTQKRCTAVRPRALLRKLGPPFQSQQCRTAAERISTGHVNLKVDA